MGYRPPQPVRPYYREQVNAGSAVTIPWQVVDSSLDPVTLASARYRVDNLTDSLVIKDWTAIDEPPSKGSLVIPASLNGMSRDYRDRQLNQVTFEFTDESGNVLQQMSYYELAAVFVGAA